MTSEPQSKRASRNPGTLHAMPPRDLFPHLESFACPCVPEIDHADGLKLVLHRSFDERETEESEEAFFGQPEAGDEA